jgi:hypothetical protein
LPQSASLFNIARKKIIRPNKAIGSLIASFALGNTQEQAGKSDFVIAAKVLMNQISFPQAKRDFFSPESVRAGEFKWWLVLPALAASLLAFLALTTKFYAPLLAILGAVAVVGLVWAIRYTTAHPEWLACFLVMLALLIDASFFADRTRAVVHYGLLVAFCLPILPKILNIGIWQGGFRQYLLYFAWALITVTYSSASLDSVVRLVAAVLSFGALAAGMTSFTSIDRTTRLLSRYLIGCVAVLAITLAGSLILRGAAWQTPLDSFNAEYVSQLRSHGITVAGLDRFRGIFSNPNTIGVLMLATVSSSLIVWKSASRKRKFMLAIVMAAALASDLAADSRTPLVALGIGGAAYLLWKYRTRGALAFAALLALAVAVLVVSGVDLHAYAMRGQGDLTGRTDMWRFVIQQIKVHPVLGYGYETAGNVLKGRYSPLWDRMWNEGSHTSLHDGYLDHMVGVGIPATIFWLYIMLRPWVFVFRQPGDPGHLKSIALLIVIPLLIHNLTEASLGDCDGPIGVLFALTWFMAERYRLLASLRAKTVRNERLSREPAGVRAILSCQSG